MARRIRDRVFKPNDDPGAWAEAMGRSNIPVRYHRATFEGVASNQTRDWARAQCDDIAWRQEGKGFVLVGPFGKGKSSVAGLLAVDSVMRCEKVLWLASAEVPGVMFREGDRNAALHERLQIADLLVIDDLGSESYSMERAGGSALERCIRTIYDANRSIVLTSNLSPARIKDEYPAALVSVLERVTEMVVIE